jgi:hypothetical protein
VFISKAGRIHNQHVSQIRELLYLTFLRRSGISVFIYDKYAVIFTEMEQQDRNFRYITYLESSILFIERELRVEQHEVSISRFLLYNSKCICSIMLSEYICIYVKYYYRLVRYNLLCFQLTIYRGGYPLIRMTRNSSGFCKTKSI